MSLSPDERQALREGAMKATGQGVQAWIIGGEDTVRDGGWIDAMAWQEGEFSVPLVLKSDLEAADAKLDAVTQERDDAIEAVAETMGGLILAAAANGRANAAEAQVARLKESLAEAEYTPGDHPVVPVKIATFMAIARAALTRQEHSDAQG